MKRQIQFCHRAVVIIAIGLLWMSRSNAMDLIGMSAVDVTTCEYDSKNVTLVDVQIHAARLFTDYERHGFFRIGLLPIPVAEDIQIEIRSADCLTNALSGLHFGNESSLAERRFEFRNLEIKSFDEKQPRLSARLARIGRDGTLELSNVSIPSAAGGQTFIPKATLQITNPSAGWISWNSGNQPQGFFLFNPRSDK